MTHLRIFIAAVVLTLVVSVAAAQTKPATIKWSGKSTAGADLVIPAPDKPTVVMAVRADQPQSREAIKQAKAVLQGKQVQVLTLISGERAAEQVKAFDGELGFPSIIDPDYAISGSMDVHVWPTTVVIRPDGQITAHLAGLSPAFAQHLDAHADFAAGKIDQAALKKRLADEQVVASTDRDRAQRHLQVASMLVDKQRLDEAAAEIEQGLKLAPDDAALKLAKASLLIAQGKPDEALAIAEKIPAGALPPWNAALVRGRALLAQKKWAHARAALEDAIKLNPKPAEAHYLMGIAYQNESNWAQAAAQFRAAYEAAAPGQKVK